MLLLSLITTLATTGAGLAIKPRQDGGGTILPFPASTTVTFYQGSITNDTCAQAVSTGTYDSEVCYEILVDAVGVASAANATCSFVLWKGSVGCDGSGRQDFSIGSGNASVCVSTGVYDGGVNAKASGMWTCG